MLRKNFGDAVKNNLKRSKSHADHGRGAKLTSKNLNQNYVGGKLAALPPMIKLDPSAGSVPDQLNAILTEHSVKLIDLFREWDADGDGEVSKKEFRKAMPMLGLEARRRPPRPLPARRPPRLRRRTRPRRDGRWQAAINRTRRVPLPTARAAAASWAAAASC
ncbi:MAG: EF-hand domain-containing protein, partial [Pseudomonadota bacterium]|nr:EF-hand domain-containing protein [Pseudomonadota bacterium]